MRRTGVDALGEVPWGTHLCQFYRTAEDLAETLVPYFREGLLGNEFCLWVASEPLPAERARDILAAEVTDLEDRIAAGQMEILDYRDWYTRTGTFDPDRVLRGWLAKHDAALSKGFEGLRLTGNTSWLDKADWSRFSEYEETINRLIGGCRILALCTYCIDRCGAPEIIDVVSHHQSALIRKEGRWVLIETNQQKQFGQALREQGDRLRFALEAARLGEWDMDLASRAIERSPRHDQIFGYEGLLPQWTYGKFLEHVLPEDRPRVEERLRQVLETRQDWNLEVRILRRDGAPRWIWLRGGVSAGSDGKPQRIRGVIQDITERKEAEQALLDSERRFRGAVEGMIDACGLLRPVRNAAGKVVDFTFDYVNQRVTELAGRPREEYSRLSLVDMLHETDREKVLAIYTGVLETGSPVTVDRLHIRGRSGIYADGACLDLRISPLGDTLLATWHDVTEKARAEDALRESELQHRALAKAMDVERGKLATIIESLDVGVVIADGRGEILSMNGAALRFHDFASAAEMHTAMEDYGRLHETRGPDGRSIPIEEWPLSRALKGENVRDFEMHVRNVASGRAWIGCYNVHPVRSDAGDVVLFVITIHDMTAIRRTESQVRSMALFPQQNPSPVLRLGKDGVVLHANPAAEAMMKELGWSGGPAAPAPFAEVVKPMLAGGSLEADVALPGDRTMSFMIASAPGEDYVNLYGRDVTRVKMAERALKQSHDELEKRVRERTAALSQAIDRLEKEVARRTQAEKILRERSEQMRTLASELTLAEQRERRRLAQVLHDNLQQLLVGVKYRLKTLQGLRGKPLQETAREMDDLLARTIDVSRLITYDMSPPILYDGGLIRGLEWLASWMEEKYGLKVDLDVDEKATPGNEAVTLLLFQGARELLFNVLKHAGVRATRLGVSCREGQMVVEVSDRGRGFDPEVALRGRDVSCGFGLFSLRERLELMGGHLEAESRPGKGSCIRLRAPVADNSGTGGLPPGSGRPGREGGEPAATKSGSRNTPKIRVILVDDHAVVRKGLAQLLKNEPDIEVVAEGSDGEVAIKLTRELSPDVVVMDIGMPGMDGFQATEIIHEEFPEVKVIGLSIYEDREQGEAMRRAGAAAYLTKSAPPDDVIQAIRSCVRAGGRPPKSASRRHPVRSPGVKKRHQ